MDSLALGIRNCVALEKLSFAECRTNNTGKTSILIPFCQFHDLSLFHSLHTCPLPVFTHKSSSMHIYKKRYKGASGSVADERYDTSSRSSTCKSYRCRNKMHPFLPFLLFLFLFSSSAANLHDEKIRL